MPPVTCSTTGSRSRCSAPWSPRPRRRCGATSPPWRWTPRPPTGPTGSRRLVWCPQPMRSLLLGAWLRAGDEGGTDKAPTARRHRDGVPPGAARDLPATLLPDAGPARPGLRHPCGAGRRLGPVRARGPAHPRRRRLPADGRPDHGVLRPGRPPRRARGRPRGRARPRDVGRRPPTGGRGDGATGRRAVVGSATSAGRCTASTSRSPGSTAAAPSGRAPSTSPSAPTRQAPVWSRTRSTATCTRCSASAWSCGGCRTSS